MYGYTYLTFEVSHCFPLPIVSVPSFPFPNWKGLPFYKQTNLSSK